jgi:stress response protein YsnF
MLSERELSVAIGSTAYDSSGDKIGTVEHFFSDDRTGAPTWVAISTGLFGTRHSVVPAVDATFADGALRLPVTVDAVKSAPHVADDHLDPAAEMELRRHYGMTATGAEPAVAPTVAAVAAPTPAPSAAPTQEMQAVPAAPPAGPSTTAAPATDGAMTRSEEQLRVGTERIATTRARLVKYVVTEEVQITVPIRREEIRVEEVPLGVADVHPGESLLTADQAPSYSAAPGLPDEIILHTERPVVTVEVVPTERVRLRTELVEGQETVSGQVQREQIVVDQDRAPRSASDADRPPIG